MEPIAIGKDKLLILSTDLFLSDEHLRYIRNDVIEQMKEGILVIPSGFKYLLVIKEETPCQD